MNIFKCSQLTIDFNQKLQRLSFQSQDGFASLSIPSFHVLITLLKFGSKFEKVTLDQICSVVTITGVSGEYIVDFRSKNHIGYIMISRQIVGKLIQQSEIAFARLGTLKFQSENINENILSRTQSMPVISNDIEKKCSKRKSLVANILPVKRVKLQPSGISCNINDGSETKKCTNPMDNSNILPHNG